jgi:hypothetical protein
MSHIAHTHKQECEKLGITGSGAAVQAELQQLTSQLPGLFERLVSELRSPQLQPAIAYYQAFTQYAHGGSGNGAGKQQEAAALPDVLPVLTEVRSRATPAWTGAADAANNVAPTSAAASGGIDWGISADGGDAAAPGAAAADGGITWDLGDLPAASAGAGASDAAAAGISWDLGAEAAAAAAEAPAEGDAAAAAGGGGGPSLNWDIDLSGVDMEASGQDAAAGAGGINWDVDTPAAADEGGSAAAGGSSSGGGAAARDASAAWLQHDSEYRARLVDDLQELRAFLRSRAAGLSGSSSSQDLLRALAPDVVASTDARDVAAMLGVVEGCLARLADERLRQLLMIASSARCGCAGGGRSGVLARGPWCCAGQGRARSCSVTRAPRHTRDARQVCGAPVRQPSAQSRAGGQDAGGGSGDAGSAAGEPRAAGQPAAQGAAWHARVSRLVFLHWHAAAMHGCADARVTCHASSRTVHAVPAAAAAVRAHRCTPPAHHDARSWSTSWAACAGSRAQSRRPCPSSLRGAT